MSRYGFSKKKLGQLAEMALGGDKEAEEEYRRLLSDEKAKAAYEKEREYDRERRPRKNLQRVVADQDASGEDDACKEECSSPVDEKFGVLTPTPSPDSGVEVDRSESEVVEHSSASTETQGRDQIGRIVDNIIQQSTPVSTSSSIAEPIKREKTIVKRETIDLCDSDDETTTIKTEPGFESPQEGSKEAELKLRLETLAREKRKMEIEDEEAGIRTKLLRMKKAKC